MERRAFVKNISFREPLISSPIYGLLTGCEICEKELIEFQVIVKELLSDR